MSGAASLTGLIVAVVLAMPLWVAGTATGGVDCSKYPAGHPLACPEEPPEDPPPSTPPDSGVAGFSCAEAVVYYGNDIRLDAWEPDPEGEVLAVTLTPED